MNSSSEEIEGPQWILTHSPRGGTVAFRHGKWKLIDEVNGFYDIKNDPEEKHNLFNEPSLQDKIAHYKTWLADILGRIDQREEEQNFGANEIC